MKRLFFLLITVTTSQLYASGVLPIYNAQYLADRGIIVDYKYNINAYRINDPITRAEVVGIALKTAGIQLPDNYQCKGYFADVRANDWICRAVEIAANGNFVSRANPTFRHQSAVTRAEALAIIMQASKISIEQNNRSPFSYTDIPSTSWQYNLVGTAMTYGIVSEPDCPASNPDSGLDIRLCGGVVFGNFRPNEIATRADVFSFAKKTREYTESLLGGNNLNQTYTSEKGKFSINLPENMFVSENEWSNKDESVFIKYFSAENMEASLEINAKTISPEEKQNLQTFYNSGINLTVGEYAVTPLGNYEFQLDTESLIGFMKYVFGDEKMYTIGIYGNKSRFQTGNILREIINSFTALE